MPTAGTQARLATFHLAHLPPDLNVHVALFKGVQNAPFLRQQLLDGNAAFEYAFIDACSIVTTKHVLAAVWRAVNDQSSGRMKSRNVHSEIVFSLSQANNIADAFRRFGVTDHSRGLVVVKVGNQSAEDVAKHLDESVEGEALEFNDMNLAEMSDIALVRKNYKLGSNAKAGSKKATAGYSLEEHSDLETAILGLMALRGAN